ncbi:hypothetical protein PFICI_12390 [Pestalotiopsis fici W106-1]|uniref:SGNH hydrolase-type esterase domain-containing protein n=1 Tax=Pestalotiopsis fici (strain W106-1 / CGMCC3.15140) TaxID=1229662 RepID=W3WRJ4_PESFW|nr:uncharacterized protein PFICI_12390 [Pestalotiopsis fici W106-1]ETS75446.1 hypothetical protein PFICI_12390 [Pestalotiopsis fici W106-1]
MPLGGSITHGVGSSDGNGYREILHDTLIADGYAVDMVGSRKTGKGHCHEGWRGYRIDQIAAKAAKSIPELKPNVLTINAGSNDCIQDFEINSAGDRIDQILRLAWSIVPSSTLLLSTLLPNIDTAVESRVLLLNEQIQMLWERHDAAGRKIVLVNMHGSRGPLLDQLVVDGTHPNDAGYRCMASLWREAFAEAASKGFLR